MNALLQEMYSPYLTDLGFKQKELPPMFRNCGMYLEPDPDIVSGYCWIYPADNLYAINIQNFVFKEDFSLEYEHPAFTSIGSYDCFGESPDFGNTTQQGNILLGYIGEKNEFRQNIKKHAAVSSIGITFLPGFYKEYLPERFDIDGDEVYSLLNELNGGVRIPGVETILRQLEYSHPSPKTAELYYESGILRIIALMREWKDGRAKAQDKPAVPRADMENLSRLRAYIYKNPGKHLPLNELGSIACMSRSKLTALFRQVYSMTITEYIQTVRVEKAKGLLLESDKSIGEIANMVGYKQHASFSVVFKGQTGLSPNEYKLDAATLPYKQG